MPNKLPAIWAGFRSDVKRELEAEFKKLAARVRAAKDDLGARQKSAESSDLKRRLENAIASLDIAFDTVQKLKDGTYRHLDNVEAELIQQADLYDYMFPIEETGKDNKELVKKHVENGILSHKPVVDQFLVIVRFLEDLLNHSGANGLKNAAIKELKGAVFDPGKGLVTLATRAITVARRSSRDDRTTDKILGDLEGLEELLTQWVVWVANMGLNMDLRTAFDDAFKKWIVK